MFPGSYPAAMRRMLARNGAETIDDYLTTIAKVPLNIGTARDLMEIPMSFVNDLKRFAITRLKERRHRHTVLFLDSLPDDIKKDIGWEGPNRRYQ